MRVFLIIIAVLAVALLLALTLGGGPTPPDMAEWLHTSPSGKMFASLGDTFAPRLKLSQTSFHVAAPGISVNVPPCIGCTRIAKLVLTVGDAVKITYKCAGSNCSHSLCIVKRKGGPGGGCEQTSVGDGSLVIDAKGGALDFEMIQAPATAELR